MTSVETLYKLSTVCMDILVDKPGFPDFAFVLYEGGWFTHHIVTERAVVQAGGASARGARRENYAPVQGGVFDREYADRVFYAIDRMNTDRRLGLNTDEIAIVPFDDREQEVLALGDITGTETFPDTVTVKTLDYRYRSGKRIKIYSVPRARLVEVEE